VLTCNVRSEAPRLRAVLGDERRADLKFLHEQLGPVPRNEHKEHELEQEGASGRLENDREEGHWTGPELERPESPESPESPKSQDSPGPDSAENQDDQRGSLALVRHSQRSKISFAKLALDFDG